MQAQLELTKFMRQHDALPFDAVMSLTQSLIDSNDGHYTAWYHLYALHLLRTSRHCRRLALERAANPEHYLMELDFIRRFTLIHPKNYQVWRHRECIVDKIGSARDELEHLTFQGQKDDDDANGIDAKNYHAWQYRQWLVQRFGLSLEAELSLTDALLVLDAHNNSAWNHRQFVRSMDYITESDTAFLDYVTGKCKHGNESAAMYKEWIKASHE